MLDRKRLIGMVIALMAIVSCAKHESEPTTADDGYNSADTIVSDIGDARDYPRLLEVTDSFEQLGELPEVRAIFYKTIAYNLMGQQRHALSLYYQLSKIDVKELNSQADIECYTYSYKDYVRLLCDMRRYDRALREAFNADRKLKAAGHGSFVVHHDIAQMIGECQLYLDQSKEAIKNYQKSLRGMQARLAKKHAPLDLRECQKTMNAIARALIHKGLYDEAAPWVVRQDSLLAAADRHPQRDSVFVDEMKAGINYTKALLAHALGNHADAERYFSIYQSTHCSQQLSNQIKSSEYLMLTHRYEEAARNYTQLDHFLEESGYKADLEAMGRYLLPKYRANLLAGHRDSALHVANLVAESFDTALVSQKISDADLLSTVYDTEGKERQIAEQRAELSQQRMFAIGIIALIVIIFFHVYVMMRRKAFNRLNETNRQLLLANERAEESSRMKTKFIHQISHEVRTPLNVLSGFCQVLATPDIQLGNDELKSISQKIMENSDRITKLVDKMLDLSLVNSDAAIEMNDQVKAIDIAQQAIEKSGIRKAEHLDFQLEVMPEAEALTLQTNQKAAVKALVLVLDNAIKFTHPLAFKHQQHEHGKPQVMLRISVVGQWLFFAVEDTGIGVPKEQAENIFEEFVQLDEYSDGTGIGLSISRSLARHIKGDVLLDTAYSAGARFVVSLPV